MPRVGSMMANVVIRKRDRSRLHWYAKHHGISMVEALGKLLDVVEPVPSGSQFCKSCGVALEIVAEDDFSLLNM